MDEEQTNRVLLDIDRIAEARAAISGGTEDGQFWQNIGLFHRRTIERHGFGNFKRHINFQYGQWGIHKFHSRFTLRILIALLRRGQLPRGALARVDWHGADDIYWPVWFNIETGQRVADISRSRQDIHLRAYAMYCGLLWQYASINDTLGCLRIPEPKFGYPMPVRLKGQLISQDIAMASLDLNRMAMFMPLRSKKRVLEIGAGYGRLAYLFRSLFPDVQYSIVDISPALAVSQNYLTAVFGEENVTRFSPTPSMPRALNFLLPHQLELVPDQHFDLAINVSSFDEMPPEVSARYLKTIGRLCRGHVFLNGYARSSHRGSRLGLDELRYDPAWKLLYSRPHEIFPGWVEKVFEVA